jgi:hypothetical protein
MPGCSGVTVVTNSYAFYFAYEAAGASRARHSLRPLFGESRTKEQRLEQKTCCEIVELCLNVIASEAKQSSLEQQEKSWIASSLRSSQ